MKRVTFRVPEDHEIAVSASIERMAVTARYGDARMEVLVVRNGDQFGGYSYGWFDTIDEALIAAGAHARNEIRANELTNKIQAYA